jgi:hypothetical protein
MCGISGYIGESKKPVLTYQLITKLLEKSEIRGVDAAGFWGTESGVNGNVLYHKEPGKSSLFVKKDIWKEVFKHNPNLLLVHARGASKGSGDPQDNQNNHPFTNLDKSLALVHNGKVDECEYHNLKQKYNLLTQCDSEILLRIFEAGQHNNEFGDADSPARLAGIRDIFSLINEGHMAVAAGERASNGDRLLWLFRNEHRPLWIVDMRDALGQIFFVSEPSIWEDAVYECSGVKNIARSQKLIELPTEEVWFFKITTTETCAKKVQRYEVCKELETIPWQFDGNKIIPQKTEASFEVITKLDENDRLVKPILPSILPSLGPIWGELPPNWSVDLHNVCSELISHVNDIHQTADALCQEQSMTRQEFTQLLIDLDQQCHELKGINTILER